MDYLDEIAENSNIWTGPSLMDSTDRTRTNATTSSGNVFKLREDDNMSAKISMLTCERPRPRPVFMGCWAKPT